MEIPEDQWNTIKAQLQPGDIAIRYAGHTEGAYEWATWNGEIWGDRHYTNIAIPIGTHTRLCVNDTAFWRQKPASGIAESFLNAFKPESRKPETLAAFAALFEAIQSKYGPITEVSICTSFESSQAMLEASEEPSEEPLSDEIIAYWKSVLPPQWHDEQSIKNNEAVAHVLMVERGMSLEEARNTLIPLLTEEEAAEILNISTEWLEKLLQEDTLPSLMCDDVMAYKKQRDAQRKQGLREIAEMSQDLGLYD